MNNVDLMNDPFADLDFGYTACKTKQAIHVEFPNAETVARENGNYRFDILDDNFFDEATKGVTLVGDDEFEWNEYHPCEETIKTKYKRSPTTQFPNRVIVFTPFETKDTCFATWCHTNCIGDIIYDYIYRTEFDFKDIDKKKYKHVDMLCEYFTKNGVLDSHILRKAKNATRGTGWLRLQGVLGRSPSSAISNLKKVSKKHPDIQKRLKSIAEYANEHPYSSEDYVLNELTQVCEDLFKIGNYFGFNTSELMFARERIDNAKLPYYISEGR